MVCPWSVTFSGAPSQAAKAKAASSPSVPSPSLRIQSVPFTATLLGQLPVPTLGAAGRHLSEGGHKLPP